MHDEPSVSVSCPPTGIHCLQNVYRKYKHQKIDWDADECCQPFEVPAPSKMRKDSGNPKKSSGNGMANRFHLLNLDEDEDEDDMAPAFGATKAMGITA